LNQIRGQG